MGIGIMNLKWEREEKQRLNNRHVDFRNRIHEMNEMYFDKCDARARLGPYGAFLVIEQVIGQAIDPENDDRHPDFATKVKIMKMGKPPIMNYFVNNDINEEKKSPMITIQEEQDNGSVSISEKSHRGHYDDFIEVHNLTENLDLSKEKESYRSHIPRTDTLKSSNLMQTIQSDNLDSTPKSKISEKNYFNSMIDSVFLEHGRPQIFKNKPRKVRFGANQPEKFQTNPSTQQSLDRIQKRYSERIEIEKNESSLKDRLEMMKSTPDGFNLTHYPENEMTSSTPKNQESNIKSILKNDTELLKMSSGVSTRAMLDSSNFIYDKRHDRKMEKVQQKIS